MAREIVFGAAARKTMQEGVDILGRSVQATLGPKGRNVAICKGEGSPYVTKDGVTVAKEIFLEDRLQDIGAQLFKEAATRTAQDAGDGTTTATVLACAIYREGLKLVEAGYGPYRLKAGIDAAVKVLLDALQESALPVTSEEDIERIATLSANGDTELGKIIASAMSLVSSRGMISVEEGKGVDTTLVMTEGMELDSGMVSRDFATEPSGNKAILIDPILVLFDGTLSTPQQVVPLLEMASRASVPLVLIADKVVDGALKTILMNSGGHGKSRGTLQVVVLHAPSFGDNRRAVMEDIAALTGATYISGGKGLFIEDFDAHWSGTCDRVEATQYKTVILGGHGAPEDIEDRLTLIQSTLARTTSVYEVEKLQSRLAHLGNGVAKIQIGGTTESEMRERKDRVDDALHATRSAVDMGIVPGGGVALIRACAALDVLDCLEDEEERAGVRVVRRAVEEPLRQIVKNAGGESSVVIHKLLELPYCMGYNAASGEFVDMIEVGIIDPVKVTCTALMYAASVSSMLLTTECVVAAEKPET